MHFCEYFLKVHMQRENRKTIRSVCCAFVLTLINSFSNKAWYKIIIKPYGVLENSFVFICN